MTSLGASGEHPILEEWNWRRTKSNVIERILELRMRIKLPRPIEIIMKGSGKHDKQKANMVHEHADHQAAPAGCGPFPNHIRRLSYQVHGLWKCVWLAYQDPYILENGGKNGAVAVLFTHKTTFAGPHFW